MSAFVREDLDHALDEPHAHGVDLVDGDEPAVRILIRGDVPDTVDYNGRVWCATSETHDAGDDPAILVFHPQH